LAIGRGYPVGLAAADAGVIDVEEAGVLGEQAGVGEEEGVVAFTLASRNSILGAFPEEIRLMQPAALGTRALRRGVHSALLEARSHI